MKAKYRCKETKQGDRCVKERGHDTFAAVRDHLHRGRFREWGPGLNRELQPSSLHLGRLQEKFLTRLEQSGRHLQVAVLGSDEEKGKIKIALDGIIKSGGKSR